MPEKRILDLLATLCTRPDREQAVVYLAEAEAAVKSWRASLEARFGTKLLTDIENVEKTVLSKLEHAYANNDMTGFDETIEMFQTLVLGRKPDGITREEKRAKLDYNLLNIKPELVNRVILINYLIARFDYQKYLEIGCDQNQCFDKVDAPFRIGVDPRQGGTHRMTSDEFFKYSSENFDIIHIDGLHLASQVIQDIDNSLKVLKPGGTIVLHDCNPLEEVHQFKSPKAEIWNGDVWKAIVEIRRRPDLDTIVGNFDYGCGILRVRQNPDVLDIKQSYPLLTWNDLEKNRQKWLRLSNPKEVIDFL